MISYFTKCSDGTFTTIVSNGIFYSGDTFQRNGIEYTVFASPFGRR